jgi:hypothetical protein
MAFKSRLLILPAMLLLLTACNDKLAGLADEKSQQRYDALPADSGLLLALQADGKLGDLPNLGEKGRQLGRTGSTALVEVSRDMLPALAEVEGVTGFVLWGDEKATGKLDPLLRDALLKGMAQPDWRATQHDLIGTFDDTGVDLEQSLVEAGAVPGSVSGGIVTFTATSEVIFDLLARDDLRQLKNPSLQHPMPGLK